jgi:hypothetical protein
MTKKIQNRRNYSKEKNIVANGVGVFNTATVKDKEQLLLMPMGENLLILQVESGW